MEYDRFKINSKLYVLGMISLVLCLGLSLLTLYLSPYLIWELHYNVPEFVSTLSSTLQDDYNYSVPASKIIIWLLFFVPAGITGLVAYFISNYIDNKLYMNEIIKEPKNPLNKENELQEKESALFFGFKILSLIILILFIIFLLGLFIQSTQPRSA